MIEVFIIVITALLFASAAKNKKDGPVLWGVVGAVYYIIGRLLFSAFLLLGFYIFGYPSQDFNILIGLSMYELLASVVSGLITAYILGELSGIQLNRAFK